MMVERHCGDAKSRGVSSRKTFSDESFNSISKIIFKPVQYLCSSACSLFCRTLSYFLKYINLLNRLFFACLLICTSLKLNKNCEKKKKVLP